MPLPMATSTCCSGLSPTAARGTVKKPALLKAAIWRCFSGCGPGDVRRTRAPLSADTAAQGHHTVLQWVRSAGRPWDEVICSAATANGHLEVLQWARANGCAWDVRTCHAAILADRPALTEWLRANGCPWSKWATK